MKEVCVTHSVSVAGDLPHPKDHRFSEGDEWGQSSAIREKICGRMHIRKGVWDRCSDRTMYRYFSVRHQCRQNTKKKRAKLSTLEFYFTTSFPMQSSGQVQWSLWTFQQQLAKFQTSLKWYVVLGANQNGFDPEPLETQHFHLHSALYFSLHCSPDPKDFLLGECPAFLDTFALQDVKGWHVIAFFPACFCLGIPRKCSLC